MIIPGISFDHNLFMGVILFLIIVNRVLDFDKFSVDSLAVLI
jgi:hypothetical protein